MVRNILISISMLIIIITGCSRENVLSRFADVDIIRPPEYGDGSDGDITVYYDSGHPEWYPVDIRSIYEDDAVPGVITYRGIDRGLNQKGLNITDTYDPQNGRYIIAKNMTVQSGAVLTAEAWGDGSDNRKGIVWIKCIDTLLVEGEINVSGKGGNGGEGGTGFGLGGMGVGTGGGQGGNDGSAYGGGTGGSQYGESSIIIISWGNIIGSGGGGGFA